MLPQGWLASTETAVGANVAVALELLVGVGSGVLVAVGCGTSVGSWNVGGMLVAAASCTGSVGSNATCGKTCCPSDWASSNATVSVKTIPTNIRKVVETLSGWPRSSPLVISLTRRYVN